MNRRDQIEQVGAALRAVRFGARDRGGRLGESSRPCGSTRRAFSLLEVVAAVAIFAVGMLAILGLFAPVTKSVANVTDSEAATRVADAVRARLQAMPFDAALALVQLPADVRKNDGDGTYNPNDGTKHPAVLFGELSGEIGVYDAEAKAWLGTDFSKSPHTAKRLVDADKFFEIDLIRNDRLSPVAADATAAMVAFNLRVRWPAFVLTTSTTAVQNGQASGGSVPFDQSKKQVMFFTGSIQR